MRLSLETTDHSTAVRKVPEYRSKPHLLTAGRREFEVDHRIEGAADAETGSGLRIARRGPGGMTTMEKPGTWAMLPGAPGMLTAWQKSRRARR